MLKKKLPILIGGLLAFFVIVGVVGAGIVYAQGGTPPAPPAGQVDGRGPRGPHEERGLGQTELEAAAKVLGMTTDEVSTALKDGKTLEELATAAGVEIQDVRDAISAARAVEMRAQIEQAVTDGTITQEKADWLLEGLDKGYLDGPGFGFGFGHGGPGGPGQPPQSVPSATP